MNNETSLIKIANRIIIVNDQKVMLDRDLAELYGVELKVLNQAVKRNIHRFPIDFMFKVDQSDKQAWSQIVTIVSTSDRNYMKRNPPFVFTEPGCFALSFVLNTDKSIEMGQFILRAFVHLRRFILKNENLMFELKNNENLSKAFANFEKKIEQNLIVLYKNNSLKDEKLKKIEEKLKQLENELNKLKSEN